jgi:16S rRNA processing protein RimM
MSWKTLERFTEIGKTGKKHGLHGELKLHVPEPLLEDCLEYGFIFLDMNGSIVPFNIEDLRFTGSYLVKLERVDNPADAVELVAKNVYLPSGVVSQDMGPKASTQEYADLKGFHIAVHNQIVGVIQEVREFPQQEMAVVHTGSDGERLVPLNPEFILSIDTSEKVVHMDLPEGLLTL